MKKFLVLIIQSLIGCGLVLGFFYLVGIVELFAEKHFILFLIISAIALTKIFKEFCK